MNYTTLIDIDQLEALLQDSNVITIDCRFSLADKEWGRKEFEQSHIPGAQYLHLDEDLSAEILPGITGRHPWPSLDDICSLFSNLGIDNNTQLVVYDQSHGGIAARLWAMSLFVGHENVCVLNGGWKHWTLAGKQVSVEQAPVTPTDFLASPPLISLVGVDDLVSFDHLIDARANKRYKGIEEPIDPIAGHIPGAINIPFLGNVDEDHLWYDKEIIRKRFDGLNSGSAAIYCGSGVTACHDLVAMKYVGFALPSLYPGSWSHYITDSQRPVVTA